MRETLVRRVFESNRLAVLSILGAFFVVVGTGFSQAADSQDIVDLNQQWKFRVIDGLFEVHGRRLICAETADRSFIYWEPQTNSIVGPANKGCIIGPGITLLKTLVQQPPGVPGVQWDTSYAGGAAIWSKLDPYSGGSARCGLSNPFYFQVIQPDGTEQSFYVVARVRTPTKAHIEPVCGDAEGMVEIPAENFVALSILQAIDVGDGKTLLFGDGVQTNAVLLLVKSLPTSLWSNGSNVFVVPHDLLSPELRKAGADEAARYKALLAAIGQNAE